MEQPDSPAHVISVEDAEHYRWGGKDQTQSDGWYLLRSPGMHVIEELMPPGSRETRHFHTLARQFFYVLDGELTMEVEHHEFVIGRWQGIEIGPRQQHRAINGSAAPVRFLVMSQPPSHGDRTESP